MKNINLPSSKNNIIVFTGYLGTFRSGFVWYGTVGIETGYGLDDQGLRAPVLVGSMIFSS
jgi:hypothetical protein